MRRIGGSNLVTQELFQITEKDAILERQPFFLQMEPGALVAGGATATVDQQIAWRDFVCTKLGFTSDTLGFPVTPGRWRLTIQDIGAQRNWQPAAFDVTAAMGGNFGMNDQPPLELPVPWVFREKTTVRAQFTNRDPAIPAIPTLVLMGFLCNWENEAIAGRANQQLELAVMKRLAGQE